MRMRLPPENLALTNQEKAKAIIREAGMELTDEEMDQVAGGTNTLEKFLVGNKNYFI